MRIATNGVTLNAIVHEPNGTPIIFLHFGTACAAVWEPVMAQFRENYWAIAADLRGHGQSDKPREGYTRAALARDIVGLMDALGIGQAHFVGSSMGSETALALAAEYPDRVLSLALEGLVQNAFGPHSSYGDLPPAEREAAKTQLRARRAARPPLATATADEAVRTLAAGWGRPAEEHPVFAAGLRHLVGPLEDGRYGHLAPAYAADAYMEDFWEARFDRDLARVQCPVLFLPDEPTLAEPDGRASLEWFRTLPADCDVVELPGAEHAAVILEQPEAVARAVLDFHRRKGF
jgi:pimeloyl-ACP methyl ester carboxylesterase